MDIDEDSDECLLPEATTFDGLRSSSGDDDSADEPVSISSPPSVARTLPAGADGFSPNSARDDRLTAEYRGSPDATDTGEIYIGDRTPPVDPGARLYTFDIVTVDEPYSLPRLGALDLCFAAVTRYETPEGAQDVVDSLEASFRDLVRPDRPVSGSYQSSEPLLLTDRVDRPDDLRVKIPQNDPAAALELRVDAGPSDDYILLEPTPPQ